MRKNFKNKHTILLVTILLIAAFLRLYKIQDYLTFLGDEGRDVLVAYNILHGHLTLLGPTASVGGFYFGPIYYYFMAPALFLAHYNPVGPAIMVALFGIATVWVIYKIGKEFFTPSVGLLAAFFYAISPVIIAYSRSSWNPNPVPFFALLVLWYVYKKKLLLAGIFLGIAVELHFIVAILGIAVFFYLLFIKICAGEGSSFKTLLKQYRSLAIGFFIGWLPYLGFEVRHGFPNTRSVIAFVFHSDKISSGNTNFFMIIGDVFFRLFARLVIAFPPSEQFPHYGKSLLIFWICGVLFLAIGSVILLLWQLIHAYAKKQKESFPQLAFVLCWLFFGVILFGVYKRQIYEYYFGFMFPLPFLLIANLLVFLWKKNTILKSVSIVIFFVLCFLNFQGIPFRYQPNRQLHQMEFIAQFVDKKTDKKPFNFALVSGNNSDYAYRYFFTRWHHTPQTIQNTVIDPQRHTVAKQLFVVCESLPCQPLGNPLFEIAGFGRAEIVGHWYVSVVEVYKLVPYKGK